jgi:hypothetical protein
MRLLHTLVSDCSALASLYDLHCSNEDEIEEIPWERFQLFPPTFVENWFSENDESSNPQLEVENHFKIVQLSKGFQSAALLYLLEFELDISLLLKIYIDHEYRLSIDDLVEAVRMLDILGSKKMEQYVLILYHHMKLSDSIPKTLMTQYPRLPVSILHHCDSISAISMFRAVCRTGSRQLVEYFLQEETNYVKSNRIGKIINSLCCYGYLNLLQQFYSIHQKKLKREIICEAFIDSCTHGQLEIAQWIRETGLLEAIPRHLYHSIAFRRTCRTGNQAIVEWLYHIEEVNIHEKDEDAFRSACIKGHLSIAQWLYHLSLPQTTDTLHINPDSDISGTHHHHHHHHQYNNAVTPINLLTKSGSIFPKVCEQGHLEIAQWLYSLESKTHFRKQRTQAFILAIKKGHYEVAKWLVSLGEVDIHITCDAAFRFVCDAGHLEMAQWLYSLGQVDIHVCDEEAFRWACQNGHLAIVQWLYSLDGTINISVYNHQAFRDACANGNLELSQWLYQIGGSDFNIHMFEDEPFRYACESGHLEIAKWLYSLGDINIHVASDAAFRGACSQGHFEVAQWLYSLGNIDIHASGNDAILQAQRNEYVSLSEWLLSLVY